MSLAAEPRPASLPLPGGSEGAAVRLHPLLIARASARPGLVRSEGGRRRGLRGLGIGGGGEQEVEVPVVAFCVEHPVAGAILIDTGFHSSVAIDPAGATGSLGATIGAVVEMGPDKAVPDQLRKLGIEPADVGTIVMTHLHPDHAGGIGHFPGATFVVDRVEWQAAIDGGERDDYVARQFDHAFDYRLLDFEGPGAASFSSFGHALDLFGDGSVMLVSTPGHSAGHLSVVLRLQGGHEAFVAADAIPTMDVLENETVPTRVADEHRFKRSVREAKLYLAQSPHAVVIPGHDLERWRELPTHL